MTPEKNQYDLVIEQIRANDKEVAEKVERDSKELREAIEERKER